MTLAAGINGASAGATFFAIKHIAVLPALTLMREDDKMEREPNQPFSWTAIRTRELPETATTGALTGAILSSARYTAAKGAARGALTGTILCSVLQLAFNELEAQRVKYVRRLRERQAQPPPNETEPSAEPDVSGDVKFWRWLGVKKISPEEHLAKLREERDLVWKEIQRLEREEAEKPMQEDRQQP